LSGSEDFNSSLRTRSLFNLQNSSTSKLYSSQVKKSLKTANSLLDFSKFNKGGDLTRSHSASVISDRQS
jgi:hypothetical protein